MEIVHHKNCTTVIGAPADMQEDCSALPVHYENTEHGVFAVSYWKPSAEELKALVDGAPIALFVRAPGRQHPVVAVAVATE